MPVIATFMGLIIKMYFQQAEHNPPHVHAEYAGTGCAVSITSGKILDGRLPIRQRRIIRAWIKKHQAELMQMWNTQSFHKIDED